MPHVDACWYTNTPHAETKARSQACTELVLDSLFTCILANCSVRWHGEKLAQRKHYMYRINCNLVFSWYFFDWSSQQDCLGSRLKLRDQVWIEVRIRLRLGILWLRLGSGFGLGCTKKWKSKGSWCEVVTKTALQTCVRACLLPLWASFWLREG